MVDECNLSLANNDPKIMVFPKRNKFLRVLFFEQKFGRSKITAASSGTALPSRPSGRLVWLLPYPKEFWVRCWYVAQAHTTQHEDPNRPPTKHRHSLQPTSTPATLCQLTQQRYGVCGRFEHGSSPPQREREKVGRQAISKQSSKIGPEICRS